MSCPHAQPTMHSMHYARLMLPDDLKTALLKRDYRPLRIRSNKQPSNRLYARESDTEDCPFQKVHGLGELNLTLPVPPPRPGT